LKDLETLLENEAYKTSEEKLLQREYQYIQDTIAQWKADEGK
jgi:hypothetical protein